jgi:benzoyl-CoA-dihydrodiol lyase
VRLLQRRVLKRFDNTARSFYAVADRADSCFAGVLLELALGADRFYMQNDNAGKIGVMLSVANQGFMTTSSGLSRLEARFYGEPERVKQVLARGVGEPIFTGEKNRKLIETHPVGAMLSAREALKIPSEEAESLGIATIAADDIDFEDELRIAIEERASLSPDALTGMEASLRFVGPETLETKIFGRLSAWQNWIFTRPNASGPDGALRKFGTGQRADFDRKRV